VRRSLRRALLSAGSGRSAAANRDASTVTRRYLSGPPIDAPVTVAFGYRDLLLFRHLSRHLGELAPGTHLGTLPGCGHVPMADNPLAVTALITASTAGGLPGKRQAPCPYGAPRSLLS
jgi:pimeloyl-ACP methyl ester carboxylesterase